MAKKKAVVHKRASDSLTWMLTWWTKCGALPTKSRSTHAWSKVTCLNCLRSKPKGRP